MYINPDHIYNCLTGCPTGCATCTALNACQTCMTGYKLDLLSNLCDAGNNMYLYL